jgi:hypothetical protein
MNAVARRNPTFYLGCKSQAVRVQRKSGKVETINPPETNLAAIYFSPGDMILDVDAKGFPVSMQELSSIGYDLQETKKKADPEVEFRTDDKGGIKNG